MKVICLLLTVLFNCNCKVIDKKYELEPGKPRINPIVETTSDNLIKDLLLYHKVIRDLHGLTPLEYNDSLKEYARLRAMILAFYEGNSKSIGDTLHVGENIWFEPKETTTNASIIIRGWYSSQLSNWNYAQPKIQPNNSNFAQMVWKETTQVGCGQAYSARSNPGTYTICYYFPAGLKQSQESANIPLPVAPSLWSSQSIDTEKVQSIVEEMVKKTDI